MSCKCFSCKNKGNKDRLIGYYTGLIQAYRDASNQLSKPDKNVNELIEYFENTADEGAMLLEEVEKE